MYAITGASGHIGHSLAERLLNAGQKVRVIARNRSGLLDLERAGASVWTGDLRDTEFLVRVFSGSTGVFAMIPPSYGETKLRAHQGAIGQSIADALLRSSVGHVVSLSSLGAELEGGTGPILGLHDQEERLNRLQGLNVVHLRPTFFMENLLASAGAVAHLGVLTTALRGDLRFPIIATRDIAEVACNYLLRLNWHGKSVHLLLGERDVTLTEVARVFGQAIGRPELPYVQAGYDDARKALIGMGCSDDVARSMIDMLTSINEGRLIAGTPRTAWSTTPTSIEAFAWEFVQAYTAATHRAAAA